MTERLQIEAEIAARDAATPALTAAGRGFQGLGSVMDRFVITAGDTVDAFQSISASIEEIGTQQRTLAVFREQLAAAGEDFEQFTEQTRTATSGTVADLEAIAQSAQAVGLGLDASLLPQLFETARIQAAQFGRDTSDSLNDIVVGLGRLSPRILDNIGLIIDEKKAFDDFAEALGTTAERLTEFERKQALSIAAIEEGRENAEKYGSALGGLGQSLDRINAALDNTKNSLIQGAIEWVNSRDAVQSFNEKIEEWLGNSTAVVDRTQEITDAAKAQRVFMDDLTEAWARLSASQKAIDEESKSLLETLREVGVTTVPEAEANIEKLNTRLGQLSDLQKAGILTWEAYQSAVGRTNESIEANEAVIQGNATSVEEWSEAQRRAAEATDEVTGSVGRERAALESLSPRVRQITREAEEASVGFEKLADSTNRASEASRRFAPNAITGGESSFVTIGGGTFSVPSSGRTTFRTTELA